MGHDGFKKEIQRSNFQGCGNYMKRPPQALSKLSTSGTSIVDVDEHTGQHGLSEHQLDNINKIVSKVLDKLSESSKEKKSEEDFGHKW
ncbi:hypothetical protein ScPMuIL_016884 [Solemya velum]